jgi:sugar lactone lactonase YvrE
MKRTLAFLLVLAIWKTATRQVPGSALVADGRPAVDAAIDGPGGIAVDHSGNLYITSNENKVYKVGPDGIVRRIAGTGVPGFSGDGGPATAARLEAPAGVAVDSKGNVYVADSSNRRVRRITPGGMIETVAGNGEFGHSGDGGPARAARISIPNSVAVDSKDNLYVSGDGHIRKVAQNGVITTISTNLGRESIAVDTDGNVYAVETNLVRKITPAGQVTVFAGNGQGGATSPGIATQVPLGGPTAVTVDTTGNVYIATGHDRVWKVSKGRISAFAGGGRSGLGDGSIATAARLNMPAGLATDEKGNVYIADSGNHRVRKVGVTGTIDTVAGTGLSGYRGDGGPATEALLVAGPIRIAIDRSDSLYIADFCRVRKVNRQGTITTVAGTGACGFGGDGGPATAAQINEQGLGTDAAGNLYIADTQNSRIRRVTPDGIIRTVAGNGTAGDAGDGGPATAAQLRWPDGVAADGKGNVYIADGSIRKVTPNGVISTLIAGAAGYGGPVTEDLKGAESVFIDASDNVFVADTNNHRIRKLSPGGALTTVAGNGTAGFSGDGGPATTAQLNSPQGVVAAVAGNLYIADSQNLRVRKIGVDGIIRTIVGVGRAPLVEVGFSGDGGPATFARLSVTSIAFDSAGNLYVGDQANRRVRKITPDGTISTAAGIGPPAKP